MDQSEYPTLRSSLERLTLNDSSVSVRPDSSSALGQGWRIGFLGLLHMEVFTQRLEEVLNYNYYKYIIIFIFRSSVHLF